MPVTPTPVAIVMPVLDDWAAAAILCRQLQSVLAQARCYRARVYLVDDGSVNEPEAPASAWMPFTGDVAGLQALGRSWSASDVWTDFRTSAP